MIRLHRLNGREVVVNAELVESIEAYGGETVIHLATGNRIVVTEPVTEVISRTVDYRKTVYAGAAYVPEYLKEGARQ